MQDHINFYQIYYRTFIAKWWSIIFETIIRIIDLRCHCMLRSQTLCVFNRTQLMGRGSATLRIISCMSLSHYTNRCRLAPTHSHLLFAKWLAWVLRKEGVFVEKHLLLEPFGLLLWSAHVKIQSLLQINPNQINLEQNY